MAFSLTHCGDAFERIFGARSRGAGRTTFVVRNGELVCVRNRPKKADNGLMRSLSMGCYTPSEQQKRLAKFREAGIEASYDRATGELLFEGGYAAQRKLAQMHKLEID